jgi:hypothetical protein
VRELNEALEISGFSSSAVHIKVYSDVWFVLKFQDRVRFVQLSSNIHNRSSGTLETLKSQANKLECWMQTIKIFIEIFW